ncbi:MAG: HEAT repeat domain-containing protein [Pseudomonadota bacterium]
MKLNRFVSMLLASLLTSFFWPQQIEQIKEKLSGQIFSAPSLNSYDINILAKVGSEESIRMLLVIADSEEELLQILTIRKILDLYLSSWYFSNDYHEKLTVEKILLKWLNSQSTQLKITACQLAREGGFTQLKQDVAALIHDPDYDVKLECMRAFFDLHAGSEDKTMVIEKYPNILSSGYHEIKSVALKKLGELNVKESFPTVVSMTGSDNPLTRSVALISAAMIDPDKSFPYVTAALDDEDYQVRLSALTALGHIQSEKSLQKLISLTSDAGLRTLALKEISRCCLPQAIDTLMEYTGDKNLSLIAVEGLLSCGELPSEKLGSLLKETGDKVKLGSLLKIMRAKPSQAYLEPLRSVRDKVNGLETEYLQCLGKIPGRESLITILSFTESSSPAVRSSALKHADEMCDETGYDNMATDIIINSISDQSDAVRHEAIRMAGKWKIKEAAPFLKKIMLAPEEGSSNETQRVLAAIALLQTGEQAASGVVIDGLYSYNPDVRSSCAEAIIGNDVGCSNQTLSRTVGSDAFYEQSEAGYFERFIVAGAVLARCDDPAAEARLKKHLGGDDDEIFLAALIASLLSSRPALVEEIRQLLVSGGTDARREASTRLWLLHGPDGRDLIELLLSSDDAYTRSGSLLSLIRSESFGDNEKISILLEKLDDEFEGVRVNAMAGLSVFAQGAQKHGKTICKKLDRPLTTAETIAALDLCSSIEAGCIHEKLERMILGNNRTIKKSAIKALMKIYSGDEKPQIAEKLRFSLAACSLNDFDKANRQVCAGLLKGEPVAAAASDESPILPYTFPYPAPLSPFAYPASYPYAYPPPLSIATGYPGVLEARKEIIPFEYSIAALKQYPTFYPFYFVGKDMKIVFLFKGSRWFSGVDFEDSGPFSYFDPLQDQS